MKPMLMYLKEEIQFNYLSVYDLNYFVKINYIQTLH